ncbi:MAG: hypothetical protein GAK41_01267 [Burkholderia gladioli]|nr:MAG: hypothetical protein GAK41_01267 [Burkholderia gladioli]
MPIEPSGTRPISTRLRDSLSHSIEPRPIPIEKVASSTVTTSGLADITSLAKPKNEVRNVVILPLIYGHLSKRHWPARTALG